jgi:hypothetical protein
MIVVFHEDLLVDLNSDMFGAGHYEIYNVLVSYIG